ncbi:hypothetical protein [Microbacterium sp. H83]|uniref:hypothetical protein n=1 Tax=Microbacterium sp. H83 TaxID=1827324 RepID=UPI0007F3A2B6|nr:hypothetical protein [Microbacterium sp. H83]OAN43079.1 hypothetical protein A4X16_08515 [Microbacterium sp. H83]
MRSTGPLAVCTAAALALVLAGCSGSGDADLDYEDSPLTKYLSSAYGGDLSQEEQQKQFEEQQRQQEELMAECMADEGFEYTPNLQSGGIVFSDDEVPWEPDEKEWVEKYGYGIVNNPYNDMTEEQSSEEYVDPNAEYVQSLSESEQTAFYETAYGVPPEEDELAEDGSYEYSWEDAGCQGWAQHELQGEDPWQADEFAELRTKMDELWTSLQDAPEYAELNAAWAACMDEGGEPGFATQMEAQQSISDEQSALFDAAYGDGTTEVDPEAAEFEDPSTSPEMKALGEREIELAIVDLGCRAETSYTKKSLEIQFALEEKFIAENKADLEAFKAAAEQNS